MYDFYYKKDRLNQLRGFCLTVKTNSIVKAGLKMGVEAGTVSKQIRALERDLGTDLFDRETKKRRLILNDRGREFYKVAVEALQNIDGVFSYFKSGCVVKDNKEIRIAAHHTIFIYLIPKFIKKFLDIRSDAEFNLEYLSLDKSLEMLYDDELDIVLYPIEKVYQEFDVFRLYDLEPVIMVNKDNELAKKKDKDITFKDLSKQNVLMIDTDRVLPYFNRICEEFDIKSTIRFKNANWEMIRNFVKLDLGVHLYTELYNKFPMFSDYDIVAKKVPKLFPNVKINLITKKGKIHGKYVSEFIKTIKDSL